MTGAHASKSASKTSKTSKTSTLVTRRDPLGACTVFYDPTSARSPLVAGDLVTLLAAQPRLRDAGLDRIGVDVAWGTNDADDRTPLAAVRSLPPGAALVVDDAGGFAVVRDEARVDAPAAMLEDALVAAAARVLAGADARRPVVAIGGGIDAPLAVFAARRAGWVVTDAIHVAIPGTTYDERESARAIARSLDLSLHVVETSVEELVAKLPFAVRAAGTALYNLHPVSRVLVAEAARALDADVLLTGEGADQASRGARGPADYVPIVSAIARGVGVTPVSPFVDDAMVSALVARAEPSKESLRAIAIEWGLDVEIARRPKIGGWAPPLPREAFPSRDVVERLARALDRPLAWSKDDRRNVGIASLAAFAIAFEVL